MIKLIHKIENIKYDRILGFLTRDDMEKLKTATERPASKLRKSSYTTWDCGSCNHSYFFAILKCPLCDSLDIEETSHPTNRIMGGETV